MSYTAIGLPKDEIEWLGLRKKYLGGSDAAAALGANPWKSRIRLYLDKTSPVIEEPNESTREMFEWGHRSEGMIAQKFSDNHPEFHISESKFMYVSREYPFMSANLDRMITDGNGAIVGILEIKTAQAGHEDKWVSTEYDIPDQYYLQCQHYMAVMGVDFSYVAVLFGGRKYREIRIDRNQSLIDLLIAGEKQFWDMVVNRTMPDPDANTTADDMSDAFPPKDATEEVVDADNDDIDHLDLIESLTKRIKELERAKTESENTIKSKMGNAQYLRAQGYKVSWNPQSRTSLDKEALAACGLDLSKYQKVSEFMTLKITKEKNT